MRLYQLGRDKWTVLAVIDEDGSCQLMETLRVQTKNKLGERMLSLLQEHVPVQGPPKNTEISKLLRDDIFEFRRQANSGPTLRVFWFYDQNQVVVCSHGLWKKTNKTPNEEIEAAIRIRAKYLRDKGHGLLRTELLPREA